MHKITEVLEHSGISQHKDMGKTVEMFFMPNLQKFQDCVDLHTPTNTKRLQGHMEYFLPFTTPLNQTDEAQGN